MGPGVRPSSQEGRPRNPPRPGLWSQSCSEAGMHLRRRRHLEAPWEAQKDKKSLSTPPVHEGLAQQSPGPQLSLPQQGLRAQGWASGCPVNRLERKAEVGSSPPFPTQNISPISQSNSVLPSVLHSEGQSIVPSALENSQRRVQAAW